MRMSPSSEMEMVKTLREAEAKPEADVAKAYAVSEPTIYPRSKCFDGLDNAGVRKLRELEKETPVGSGRWRSATSR